MPQVAGMYRGDRARKETLVEFGFRLPSAVDNRPLKGEEFETRVRQLVAVSATPSDLDVQRSGGITAEQVIRPTGLVDPAVELRPARGQVDDLLGEIRKTVEAGHRVLVTSLTKRMCEDLTTYYRDLGLKVKYLHSDIETLERMAILRSLRLGEFDTLVGVNLLREGLDLPEVALVAILDADKEGFLRSHRSLIQTIGRAARNVDGRVILYAEQQTDSIKAAVQETDRRRRIQEAYNQKHGITPQTIKKKIAELMETIYEQDYVTVDLDEDDKKVAQDEPVRARGRDPDDPRRDARRGEGAALRGRGAPPRPDADAGEAAESGILIAMLSHAPASFDRESIARIPDEPGVYQFLDDGGKVIYVGKAVELRGRDPRVPEPDRQAAVRRTHRAVRAGGRVRRHGLGQGRAAPREQPHQAARAAIQHPAPRRQDLLQPEARPEGRVAAARHRPAPQEGGRPLLRAVHVGAGLPPHDPVPELALPDPDVPGFGPLQPHAAVPEPRDRALRRARASGLTTPEEYRAILDRVVRFLSGHDREVLGEVEAEMKAAAAPDGLRARRRAARPARARCARPSSARSSPAAAAGTATSSGRSTPDESVVDRGPPRPGRRARPHRSLHGQEARRARGDPRFVPRPVLQRASGRSRRRSCCPRSATTSTSTARSLRERGGARVELVIPERGEGLRLVRIAERNAELSHREREEEEEQGLEVLDGLQSALRLVHPPRRIECYDISHLAGAQVVGSGVSFVLGKPAKALYRHYRLREVQRNDDFAALEEVLRRRLRRGLAEGDLPDLVIVDGGRPQVVRAVQTVPRAEGVGRRPHRARQGPAGTAASGRAHRVRTGRAQPRATTPSSCGRTAPSCLLLMRIRDEAHRFAIQYNRRLRRKEAVSSVLELIPGIGAKRARALLSHFGSLGAVKSAAVGGSRRGPRHDRRRPPRPSTRFFDEHRDAGVDRAGPPVA